MQANNRKVITPIGDGVTQGRFAVNTGSGLIVGILVRLPVNERTRGELSKSNCMTPRARFSGLWVFGEDELKEG